MLLKSLIKEECTFNNVRITQPLQRRVPAVPTKREYEALMHLFREKTHNYQQLGYHVQDAQKSFQELQFGLCP